MRVDELNGLCISGIDTVAAAAMRSDMVQSWLDAQGAVAIHGPRR